MTTPTMTTERRTPQRSATTNSGLAAAALKSLPHKTSPLAQARNPVMFVVWVGAALTTLWSIFSPSVYGWVVTVWLWFTIAFAAFAEAYAEGRGKAQADSLRAVRDDATANLVTDGGIEVIAASELTKGAIVRVEAGETIPGDGDVIEGAATVDESAITGESAPVVREAGGDRCAVTGGTVVLSDSILVRITSEPGSTFVDTMIALVEGAERRKTPNEIALSILLSTLTILFLIAVTALAPMGLFTGAELSPLSLVALLVCLIPTTIAALLSAVGIAGMNRLVHHNVLATSGRAVEAAGDVATLLMDKTGTITYGNRQATGLIVARGVDEQEAAEIARVASVADETPEGRSIVLWLTENYHLSAEAGEEEKIAEVIPFSASTRMSGLDLRGRKLRKGAGDAVRRWVTEAGGDWPQEIEDSVTQIAEGGGTPLPVAVEESDGTRGLLRWCSSATSSSRAWRSASPNCARWASKPSW